METGALFATEAETGADAREDGADNKDAEEGASGREDDKEEVEDCVDRAGTVAGLSNTGVGSGAVSTGAVPLLLLFCVCIPGTAREETAGTA